MGDLLIENEQKCNNDYRDAGKNCQVGTAQMARRGENERHSQQEAPERRREWLARSEWQRSAGKRDEKDPPSDPIRAGVRARLLFRVVAARGRSRLKHAPCPQFPCFSPAREAIT